MKQGLGTGPSPPDGRGKEGLELGFPTFLSREAGTRRVSSSLALNSEILELREGNSSAYAAALGCGVGWGQGEEGRVSSFGLEVAEVKSLWHW